MLNLPPPRLARGFLYALLFWAYALLNAAAAQPAPAEAEETRLTAHEIVVVANYSSPDSVELARHYMAVRGIPQRQLLVTGMPQEETLSRIDYEQLIAGPLKDFLVDEKLDHVRCVVLMYGVPLKVLEPVASGEECKVELFVRDERLRRMTELIDLVQKAHALGGATHAARERALPTFDPQLNAGNQLRGLVDQLVGEFADAAGEGSDRSAGSGGGGSVPANWPELWRRSFGFTSPRVLGLGAGAPQPVVPVGRQEQFDRALSEFQRQPLTSDGVREILKKINEARGVSGVLEFCEMVLQRVRPDWTYRASVDSELATLFWPPFPLGGSVLNPLSLRNETPNPPRTLMTCRLDGPDPAIVRRMIDTSLAVEQQSLQGKVYLDTRGIDGDFNFGIMDRDLRKLGMMIEEYTKLSVVVHNQEELFNKGECPQAALYCGWRRTGEYHHTLDLAPGAVGYHINLNESLMLHKRDAAGWCAGLLKDGAAATMGAVEGPSTSTFPAPSEFFGLLLSGHFTLGECYYLTQPRLSWMTTLIGDPLYRPFAARPALKLKILPDLLFEDSRLDSAQ